jgi:hypothetical protein
MLAIRQEWRSLVVVCLVTLTSSLTALAQTQTTGAVQGVVYEAGSLAPLAGAAISLTNEETGLVRATVTNNDGLYFISMVPPGLYTISATREGYEPDVDSATNNFPLRLSKTNLVQPPPIVLRKIGAAAPAPPAPPKTATPGAGPVDDSEVERLVNTLNATRGGNFDKRQLTALPLAETRSFEALALLLPGVAPPPQPTGSAVGPGIGAGIGASGQFSVNGSRSRSNNFTVDGSDNNDEDVGVRRQGFVTLVPQSIESLQEFQIFTHLWDAGNGRNPGSQANAVSQSGTNRLHGTLYGFFNESALNARNFFDYTSDKATSYPLTARAFSRFTNRAQDETIPVNVVIPVNATTSQIRPIIQPNPSDVKDQFQRALGGVSLGFPLSRDKTFFFASFERQHIKAQQETHFAVPTIAQRGFLGSGATGFTLPTLNLGATTNPTFRPTFTAGDAIFSLFPFPNNPVGPYGGNTFTQVLPTDGDGTIFSLKLDREFKLFNLAHTVTGRFNFTDDEREIPAVAGALFSSVEPDIRTQNLSLFLNSQLATSVFNQLRGSYGRTRLQFETLDNPLRNPVTSADPFLRPSAFAGNAPFLLNAQRLLNISCHDYVGLPQRARFCLATGGIPRDRFAYYSPGNSFVAAETNFGPGPVGQVIVAPFSPIGLDPYLFPQGRVNNTFQIADTLTFFRGRHTLKVGGDFRRTQFNSFLDRNYRPQVVFGGSIDATFTTPDRRLVTALQGLSRLSETPGFFSGSDLASLGIPTGIFQALSIGAPDSTIGLRFWQHNLFFNDNWRVGRGLTFDYGLRYEYNTVPREAGERIERTFGLNQAPAVDPTLQLESLDSQRLQNAFNSTLAELKNFLGGRTGIYEPDRNNFGPHFGFAWDPFASSSTQAGKTAIRGGAGLYYDVTLGSVVSQSRNVFPTFVPINADVNLFGGPGVTYSPIPDGYINIYNLSSLGVRIRSGSGTLTDYRLIQNGTLNVIGVPSGALQLTLGRIFNAAAAGRLASGSGLAFTLPDRELRAPYTLQYNLQAERTLFRDFLFNVAYVGARGVKLVRFRTPNGGLNSPTALINPLGFRIGTVTPEAALARPPLSAPGATNPTRPIAALGAYQVFDSSATSSYHALQVGVTKRFSRGWQMTAAYAWSHALDDVSDVFDLAGAFTLPQDDRNLRLERGHANFDIRHRFIYSTIANVPFLSRFNNARGAVGVLFGNWQFASISTYQTGQPFTVNTSFDVNGDGNLTDRIHNTGGLTVIDERQQKLSFTGNPTTLFAAIGQNGAVGRNTFRASGVAKTDFTLIRNFRVRENQSLVFRAEAFNLWNRTHFGVPVRILEAPAFGRSVSTALPARQIQLALKYLF